MFLSIGAAALFIGVSVSTLRRWEENDQLPPSHRTLGGHRRYLKSALEAAFFPETPPDIEHAVAYARVSSHDQKADLEIQKKKLERYCRENFPSFEIISDLGSGLIYRKPGLKKLLKMIHARRFTHLVINHKDRLLRFGSEIIFFLCKAQGIRVTIIEEQPQTSFEWELSSEVIELMTVFSARLYGRRSHKNRLAVSA